MTTRTATPLLALCQAASPALCRLSPQAMNDGVPTEIVVLPAGRLSGDDGRVWDNPDPDAVVSAFRSAGRDLPIDVEHSTHIKGAKGEPAPAVGWVTALNFRDGAVVATVDWNADGRALIESRAYRYISPAFNFSAAGKVVALVSVGLTNKPNLSLPALNREENPQMDRTKLIALLGLKADASDTDIEAAINSSLALNRSRPDVATLVPRADLELALNRATTAETELTKMRKDAAEATYTALVDAAVKDGKIAPTSKDHYLALCRAGQVETVKAMIGTLPTLAPGQKEAAAGDPGQQTSKLSDIELAICRNLGLAEADFVKARPVAH